MAILIDVGPVKSLVNSPDTYPEVAGNLGFSLYWRSQGRDPVQVAAGMAATNTANRAAALDVSGPENKGILNSLGRLSGVSIEQQLLRHLPGDPFIDTRVVFVPGSDLVMAADGNTLAINVFALEQRGNKVFLGDVPLLSFVANRVHQLCTHILASPQPAISCSMALGNFMRDLLREGSATLFFTMPVSGQVYNLWQDAEKRRETDISLLRQYLQTREGEKSPMVLTREMEETFGLKGPAALVAKFPLGTWMCQVIESAFGRSHLVSLLQQPQDFLKVFEQARNKFGLAEKFSLGRIL